ncbi:Eco57I restriction-modification methylase domain-containing protein [Peptacetobacter hiranonis]|uniref:Eco57I restriction-modification methylase domain-containing protein n=1 Tax=Peptacetobacter hiranonis TaxID=89152 RepID=UPI0022E2862A|nr:Eco57I restriction-modification methylase domain-containing protein [Peptacetobacter hiranonis]
MEKFKAARLYENNLDIEKRKRYGIYYTPVEMVEYIVDNTVGKLDVLKNPCPKILDSSCGCGNFLVSAFEKLIKIFEEKSEELVEKYGDESFKKENIPRYILKNCIYGTDTDKEAVEITKRLLAKVAILGKYEEPIVSDDLEEEESWDEYKATYLNEDNWNTSLFKMNIYNQDGLKINWKTKFDIIIGNPPYVGHKLLTKEYKQFIMTKYREVYRDKSDLYFCFYKNSLELLKDDGVIHLITPRYFLESISAELLRNYLEKNAEIEEIIDFLGAEVFDCVGISACIIRMRKKGYGISTTNIYRKKSDKYVYVNDRKNLVESVEEIKNNTKDFESITISTSRLQSDWIIANEKDMELYFRIEKMQGYRLYEIAESFQGVITGCDKAFILKNNDNRLKNITPKLLKDLAKSRDIEKYVIPKVNHKMIYSNDIKCEDDEKYIFENCINPYKEKLENRRECLKCIRKWYELQWGREKSVFERTKVMYPYKSRENKFAVDYDNLYSSADVYSFYLKDEYKEEFSYEYIVALLNSSIYDKYYKINAKKMSRGIYDYYPNKVMKMKIFKGDNYEKIEEYSKKIMEKKLNISDNIDKLIQKIDLLVEEDIFKDKF